MGRLTSVWSTAGELGGDNHRLGGGPCHDLYGTMDTAGVKSEPVPLTTKQLEPRR